MKALMSGMLSVMAVVAVGCGAGPAGSCQVASGNAKYCIEYHGTYSLDAAKTACTASKGAFAATACAAGAAKGCVVGKGTATEQRWVFPAADAGTGFSPSDFCKSAKGIYE